MHQLTTVRLLAVLALSLLWAPAAWSCSTCKAGDPTITLLGTEKAFSNRLRLGLDWQWREESQGARGSARRLDVREQRRSVGVSYSPSPRWTVALQLPYVSKTLKLPSLEQQEATGLGDADLSLRYVAFRSGPLSGRHLAGLHAGLRLPTAERIRDRRGQLLDIDVQPDARALAPKLGGWYAYHRYPWFLSTSLIGFAFGDGDQGFSPGNAVVSSILGQYALAPRWAVQLGLDSRYAQRNAFDGITDPDSGGLLVMARSAVAWRIGQELVLNAGLQTPLFDNFNGQQSEDTAVLFALAYDI
nr:hypothetical protein [Oceanococcus sp. HetDA_MAG_MS8]